MMRSTGIILATFILCSCASTQSTQKKAGLEFSVHVDLIKQHCGGMSPPPEYNNGYLTLPYKNTRFLVKKGEENNEGKEVLTSFTTDEKGDATFNLPEGTYCIIIEKKAKGFETFYQDNKPTKKNTEPRPEECFKKWYQKCDTSYNFDKDSSEISFSVYDYCGNGSNPCIKHTGPLPR